MASRALIPEIKKDLNVEQRIELILDLTRRLELLDDLLTAAKDRRRMTDTEVRLIDVEQAELDAMMVL